MCCDTSTSNNNLTMTVTHYISMVVISAGSFVFGILPMIFAIRFSKHCPFFLSLILCLGAGVLLATSIVHMLTEVQEKLHLSSQLYFSLGFLILYTFDEVCHFCLEGKKLQNSNLTSTKRDSYRASNAYTESETTPLIASRNSIEEQINNDNNPQCSKIHNAWETPFGHKNKNNSPKNAVSCSHSHSTHLNKDQIHCHIEIDESCSSNPIANCGLFLALVIHSILEGISIGVQTQFNEITLLLGTITFHKVVLSFCLGLELHSHGVKPLHLILSIFVFSIGSAVGIFIGTLVTSTNGIFNIDGEMQAIAAGSLLYVGAFEILPRERYLWQHKHQRRAAGLFQLFAVSLGFICITSLHMFIVHPHGNSGNTTAHYIRGSL